MLNSLSVSKICDPMTSSESLQAALARGEKDFLPPPSFYYSDTFEVLIGAYNHEIRRRLLDVPRQFRESTLSPKYEGKGPMAGESAWQPLREYLDALELHIASQLGDHSPAYWFHLYRRIAPRLVGDHEGKTDADTVALVRRIAELAFLRHGDLKRDDDLGNILRTRLGTFLGGHYYRVMAEKFGSKLKAKKHYAALRRTSQSVMLKFSEDELLRVYEVEGFAYEYWKSTAAMRSIGKGSSVEWNCTEGWFSYDDRDVHPILFGIYDERINRSGGLHTLLGTWTQLAPAAKDESRLYFASYNPNPKPELYPAWDPVKRAEGRGVAALSFNIGSTSLSRFESAHRFMSEEFEKHHGVKLEVVLFCVWAISFFGFFPDRVFFAKNKAAKLEKMLSHLTNLHFRGYSLTGLTMDRIADEALWWGKAAGRECNFTPEELRRGFEFILLSSESRKLIGLWSGGKRPLLIPQGDGAMVIDLAGIIPFLVNLFFGVRELSGAKGTHFEQGVREALSEEEVQIAFSGELNWADGLQREVDAAVRVGDRLILIECFSFERPVDYEFTKPGVFEVRKARLSEKIEQAKSLCEIVRAQPVGRNFDFSWATSVEWRLASPFVEFAWDVSDDFFDEAGIARIMNVDELLNFLKDGVPPAAELLKHMPRARSEVARGRSC